MPKFDFRLDLAVGTAYLAADTERTREIQVASLVMLGPDGTIWWVSDKAYPLTPWALDNAKEEAQKLEQVARYHWPALAGATDWYIPGSEHFDSSRMLDQEDGNVLGVQD